MTSTAPATTLEHVALVKVTTHPDNPRHDIGDVTDLAASITEHGVLEPLVVVPFGDLPDDLATGPRRKSVEYALIAGHRRLAAAKYANVKTVPVIVRHDLTTREQQIAAMVIENQHRADLSPVEEGEAYQLLLDITPKATQAAVAKTVGMPKKRVSERLRLTKLGDNAKIAVHDGQITLHDALELLAIEQRHPHLAEKVALAAGTPDFAYELKRATHDAEVLDEYDLFRDHAEDIGTQILQSAPGYGSGEPRRVGWNHHGIDVHEDGTTPDALLIGTAHAECPGAAAYIPKQASGRYELGWYCTAYADYHVPSVEDRQAEIEQRKQAELQAEAERRANLTDEERAEIARKEAEAAAERAAREERVASFAAAQQTRWDHFRAVIAKGDPKLAKWAAVDSLVHPPEDWFDLSTAYGLALLGLAEDVPSDDVATALGRLTLDQIAIYTWLLGRQYADDDLTIHPWQQAPNVDPDYIDALTDRLGYPWSTFETDEFNLDEHGHVHTETEDEDAA